MVLLSEFSAQATPEQITNMSPREHALCQNFNYTVAEVLVIIRQKTKNIPMFISMDSAKKKVIHHVAKVLAFWDKDENCLCAHQLHSDAALGTKKR